MWSELSSRLKLALGLAAAPFFVSLQAGYAGASLSVGWMPRTFGGGLDTFAVVAGLAALVLGLRAAWRTWRNAGDFERPLALAIIAAGVGAMHVLHALMTG
ncbi:MAG: hypothetical protein AAF721_25410 [Myxococcota bacterium]